MENVEVTVIDGKLALIIDPAIIVSKTSKGNTMVATSNNWAKLPQLGDGWSLNLALVKK